MKSQLTAIGIDAGSTTIKLVAVNEAGEMLGWHLEPTHPRIEEQAEKLVNELQSRLNIRIAALIGTGYGRKLIPKATARITEITCHARGVYHELGTGGTLVDIGGQDSKIIAIDAHGKTIDFMMNDKCAAGTGRFLEHTAARLGVALDDLGAKALSAEAEETISSTCTVFAESEIISLIAHGAKLENILLGLHRALTSRIVAMVRSLGLTPPLMLSGGVTKNIAMLQMLRDETQEELLLPKYPQLMGAYGAALIGIQKAT